MTLRLSGLDPLDSRVGASFWRRAYLAVLRSGKSDVEALDAADEALAAYVRKFTPAKAPATGTV